MGKMPMIAVGVVVLAVVAIVGYLLIDKPQTQAPNSVNSVNNTSNGNSAATSLRNLMAMGQNQQCTFTDVDTGSNGTVYVSNSKMRGDFVSISDSTTVNGHMIVDGDNMYIWTDGEAQGFKASMSASEEVASQIEDNMGGSANSAVDVNAEFDYECSSWSVDNSKFTLPNGVEFQDFSAMMEGVGEMMEENSSSEEGSSDQCGICDSVPAESQAQCRAALGC